MGRDESRDLVMVNRDCVVTVDGDGDGDGDRDGGRVGVFRQVAGARPAGRAVLILRPQRQAGFAWPRAKGGRVAELAGGGGAEKSVLAG